MRHLPRLGLRAQVAARRTRGARGRGVLTATVAARAGLAGLPVPQVVLGAVLATVLGEDGIEAKGAAREPGIVPRVVLLVIVLDRRQRRWARWRVW